MRLRRHQEKVKADPLDTAWRIHTTLVDWTGRADTKASFILTLESAILVSVSALFQGKRRLSALHHWPALVLVWSGVGLLIVAILVSVGVVSPRLRARRTRAESTLNYIYFGHARHWKPDKLEQELLKGDPLPTLSRQIVYMSEVAWRKHRSLQGSIWLGSFGSALIALAGIFGH